MSEVTPCPSCGEEVTDRDRFCEACGASLPLAATSVAETGATVTVRAVDAQTCPNCNASGSDATEDGYCGLCGRRWSPVREHDEWVDGPVAGVTDRGIDHWRNEDAVGVSAVDGDPSGFALVVCDGVSASQEPQVVAQAAVDAALPVLRDAIVDESLEDTDFEAVMVDATAAAQKAAADVPSDPDMDVGPGACTFVAVVVRGGVAVYGSVGDSRAYWIDDDGVTQVGNDDSLAAELVASGRVTPEQALAGPGAHTITKWLGADSPDPTPEVTRLELAGPGVVLLASDGLWNYTPDPEALATLVGPLGEEAALDLARRLVAFAEESGGADNVTVAVGPHDLDLPAPTAPVIGTESLLGPAAVLAPVSSIPMEETGARTDEAETDADDDSDDGEKEP